MEVHKVKKEAVFLRDNFESLVVAFVFAIIIKGFFLEVFKIPTSSMEPTLMGDQRDTGESGDKMLAAKTYFWFKDISRYDVVIFRYPLSISKFFIKRIVGMPDEELVVWKGNIWARKQGEREFSIQRRPLETQESIWLPYAEWKEGDFSAKKFESFWKKRSKDGLQIAGNVIQIDSTKSEVSIATEDNQLGSVDDVRAVATLIFDEGVGKYDLQISNSYGEFHVTLATEAQKSVVTVMGDVHKLPIRLEKGVPVKVDFGEYDHSLYLRINGKKIGHWFFQDKDSFPKEGADGSMHANIKLTAIGIKGRILDMRAWHDVTYDEWQCQNEYCLRYYHVKGKRPDNYHFKLGEIVKIPAGCYMVMGDNVSNSRDSRAWSKYTWKLKNGTTVVAEQYCGSDAHNVNRNSDGSWTIKEDPYGNPWEIRADEVAEFKSEPLMFVDRKFIEGRALLIWWPPKRWKIIR